MVPTLPHEIHAKLREMREPILLFGENPANVRDRLRMCMARQSIEDERRDVVTGDDLKSSMVVSDSQTTSGATPTVTKYTHASPQLVQARQFISEFSLPRAKFRLTRERKRRRAALCNASRLGSKPNLIVSYDDQEKDGEELKRMDEYCTRLYAMTRNDMALQCSQYGGDSRPLSAVDCTKQHLQCCESKNTKNNVMRYMVATAGWSGCIKLWDANADLDQLAVKNMAHEDRIMGIALSPSDPNSNYNSSRKTMIATASIDLTAKLWTVDDNQNNGVGPDYNDDTPTNPYTITETACLRGHQARLSKIAWHPTQKYVATTSFDHTWRLWDVETNKQLLLQDGHFRETYGIAMNHPDGSLCSTTDFGGAVHLWDLRTGKSVAHFLGHAKRVLCTEFSPNGFHLATAGDDGTIKVWDLRKSRGRATGSSSTLKTPTSSSSPIASIPAHSRLITQLKFSPNDGECILSASFDGTARVWSARNWRVLNTFRGHEGKVMGAGFVAEKNGNFKTFGSASGINAGGGVITVGFDKTLKLWT